VQTGIGPKRLFVDFCVNDVSFYLDCMQRSQFRNLLKLS